MHPKSQQIQLKVKQTTAHSVKIEWISVFKWKWKWHSTQGKHSCLSTFGKTSRDKPWKSPWDRRSALQKHTTNRPKPNSHLTKKELMVWDTFTNTLSHSQMGHAQEGCVEEGGALYLKWNAGLQDALFHRGGREQREVHGDTLGAHGGHRDLGLRKEARGIDRVSPRTLLHLPQRTVQERWRS